MPTHAPSSGRNPRNRRRFLPFPRKERKIFFFSVLFSRKWEKNHHKMKILSIWLSLKQHLKSFGWLPLKHTLLWNGNKIENKLLSQNRVGRSYLNEHTYQIQITLSPAMHIASHYLLNCHMYKRTSDYDWCVRAIFTVFNTYTKNIFYQYGATTSCLV